MTKAPQQPRRSPRIPLKELFTLVTKVQGRELQQTVFSVDFSRHGFRILVNRPLDQGQVVYATSSHANEPLGYCRVIWVHPVKWEGREREQAGLELVASTSASN